MGALCLELFVIREMVYRTKRYNGIIILYTIDSLYCDKG